MIESVYRPKYWLVWPLVWLLRLTIIVLPYRALMAIGKGLGNLMFFFAKKRRHIVIVNLKRCFPDFTDAQYCQTAKEAFQSAGMGLVEALIAWWWPSWRINKLTVKFNDLTPLDQAHHSGQGVVLLSAHYPCMELFARLFSLKYRFNIIYKNIRDPFAAKLITDGRKRSVEKVLINTDLKAIIASLKQGDMVWIAPDQDFGPRRSVFVEFFGQPMAMVKIITTLAKASNAHLFPAFFRRLPHQAGYEGKILSELVSTGLKADASAYNQALEAFIAEDPGQYFWLHRRFKTQPEGCSPYSGKAE